MKLISGKCTCGVLHHAVIGDATRGELRRMRERLARDGSVIHYLNDGATDVRCLCGAMLSIEESGISMPMVETNSDG